MSTTITVEPLQVRRPPRTWPKGRVCEEPFCGTILSIYNGGKFCAPHAPFWDYMREPGRPRKVAV